ncbi:MAG: aminodeoxychorismate/anthranilate synthase component II [Zymomonas mobilis]|uniref:Aminodeoxychorismate synthase glutamine amidotransferase subunit n=1 Tax=Zymomonas mobilis TaxID=542 RepID=A0A542VZA7_ZYMMB|nr:aminodeoxychorismate/anthranilate synthase component II [Zymomonas mobilis]TQL16654.1 aminodeoxychorismate synthase glutamine amidotransferase subunit [Zymomonas mobilis]
MLLMIDNYDSFVVNLARYCERLGREVRLFRHDKITLDDIEQMAPKAIILSPGPCSPEEAGISLEVLRQFSGQIPILGVCLGHQCIGTAFGGVIARARYPLHGHAVEISHVGERLFKDIPDPFKAARYNSLIIQKTEEMEKHLTIDAVSPEGEIMALSHKSHPTYGIQFHPESILTEYGNSILANFFDLEEAFYARMAKRRISA